MNVQKAALSALLMFSVSQLVRAEELILTPGPCLEKRKQVQIYLTKAKKAGIGTKPYEEALSRIENDIKSGATEGDIQKQVSGLISALGQQVNNLKSLKVRPPGYVSVGNSRSAGGNGGKNESNSAARTSVSEMESYMLTLVNKHRQEAGLGPVGSNGQLGEIARAHAQDMVNRSFFAHVNPDGKDPQDRANAAGYHGMVMENIAFTTVKGGIRSTDSADVSLMNSPPHRATILNNTVTIVGIGIAYDTTGGIRVCQLFAH